MYMAIIDDLMELYSNDIIVVIGEKEYQATSFDELISLEVDETTWIAIMDGLEVK